MPKIYPNSLGHDKINFDLICSENFSFLALPIWEWRCFEDILTNDVGVGNELINYTGVCRTDMTTPGLLYI